MARYDELYVEMPDGYSSYGRFWAARSPRGAVLYHHGIQSHCGWYESSAEYLAERGYAVLQVDRRGAGKNSIDRGHADSADQLIADAHAMRDELARRVGFGDHHVMGISWGGKLGVAGYVTDPTGVKSLSLVTPGMFPLVGVSKSEMAKIGFAMLYEQRRLFDIPLDDADLFTTVRRWQEFIDTDPLTLRKCTASFYLASRRMDKTVARLPKVDPVPIHLFIAGDERIIDNQKTGTFVRGLHWPECRITCHNTARHSLEFEGDPTVYFKELARFLDET